MWNLFLVFLLLSHQALVFGADSVQGDSVLDDFSSQESYQSPLDLMETFLAPATLSPTEEVALLNNPAPPFSSAFTPFNAMLNLLAMLDPEYFVCLDTGFSLLSLPLQHLILSYCDGQSLYQLSLARRVYQIIAQHYACNNLIQRNISIPHSSVENVFIFNNDCLPRIDRTFPAVFLRNHSVSFVDASWLVALDALAGGALAQGTHFDIQFPFLAPLTELPDQQGISALGIYAFNVLGGSAKAALSFLIANDCREPLIYEFLLSRVANLNELQIEGVKHILYTLIEKGMYFPALMERAELASFFEDGEDNGGGVEFYDTCWEVSIYSRNWPAFLALIQMNPGRFSYLREEDLARLRLVFLNPDGPAAIEQLIANHENAAEPENSDSDDDDSVASHELFDIQNNDYRIMTILANFEFVPGSHRQVFRQLVRTGMYHMHRPIEYLLHGVQFDAVREIIPLMPPQSHAHLNHFLDNVFLASIKQEEHLEVVETFTLFPHFSIFDCFDVLSFFEELPSPFLANWIDEMDPQGEAVLMGTRGPYLDPFGRKIDLLKYAVRIDNFDLAEFCLNRPQTSQKSFKSAARNIRSQEMGHLFEIYQQHF